MVCCQSDRSVGLVSAINSLIQSAACVTFGIVTMLMYECVLTPTPPQLKDATVMPSPLSAFTSSFYLQYFHSQNNCIAHDTYIWKDVNSTVTGVVTKSYQVHGIFIGYIVENGLWLLCTALLFFGSAIKSQWIYRTYSAVQFTVILYDAILIVLFGLDFKSYREFQGNTNTPWITKSSMLVNIIVMMLIVSRLVLFFILNIVLSCYLHGAASRLGSSKIIPFDPVNGNSPPKSPKRKKGNQMDQHTPAQFHYPGARVETPQHLQPNFQQQPQPFVPQTYQIPRYPDVIGHPNYRHDSSSEEVLVSASSMPNVSRSGSIPIMNREPRNLEVNRHQPTEAWASPKREITNQQPISRGNQLRPYEQHYPTVDYDSSSSIEGLPSEISYNHRRRPKGSSIASSYQDSPSKVNRSTGNVREGSAGPKLRRDSSGRSDASNRRIPEQLKNQRPWSYISPSDIPQEPNKLNQFYNNHLVPSNRDSTASMRGLTSVTDDEEGDARSQRSPSKTNQQQLKREYNDTVASAEVRQPLLAETRFPLYRPHKHSEPVYANLQTPPVKKKKNVRFNQRTHSLELLETSFPVDTPPDAPAKDDRIKADQRRRRDSKKSTGRGIRAWRSSGDELCTDEFFIVNYSEHTDQPVPRVEALNPNRTLQLTRQLSSVSSPNLVFDPATNTARLVFESKPKQPARAPKDRCHRQGACVIHASTCDGQSCANTPWNETSI